MLHRPRPYHLRSLFLSDIHLGTRGSQADRLLDFLSHYHADTIYLVGDIIDGWKLRKGWFWSQSHSDVIQELLRRADLGSRVVYIPGNHDEFLRQYLGRAFGAVEIVDSIVHEGPDGKRYLVTHGDHFDAVVRWAPWLSALGATIYNLTLATNAAVNRVRRLFGFGYWSLSDWTKRKVKNAVKIISDYEQAIVFAARQVDADGVICGHIHHADMHDRFGIRYVNTGDWVESCTAVVEHMDGRMEIVRWTAALGTRHQPAVSAVEVRAA
jgi:UDP-2,3-diacylglucosamine pyrophosphatase LpxH